MLATAVHAVREPEVNAVNRLMAFAAAVLVLLATPYVACARSTDADMREQFEAVVDGLNNNSFRKFHDAIDDKALLGRIFGTRVIENEAKNAFAAGFTTTLEAMFTASFPRPRTQAETGGEIVGTIISFTAQDGKARAIVRYAGKGYRYSYHAYELARGRGGRLVIVDWFDYYNATWFSEEAGDALVRSMPGKATVRSVLDMPDPSDGQLFQVGELLKAVRDGQPQRYFQIYDGLDEVLRREPFVTRFNYQYCRLVGDPARLDAAVAQLVAVYPDEPKYGLSLSEYYIAQRDFAQAITALERFEEALGMKDGVAESFKATSAMALGDLERAQAFALSATQVEPDLELSWWTLLRTRTAAGNYAGATEALSQLEDRFGKLLIPQKLRRDRFLKVLIDQPEYKDWRAARDQG